MLKPMKCAREHDLIAPYFYFGALHMTGEMTDEALEQINLHADWFGDRPPPRVICAHCIIELLELMERWRQSDPELQALIDKWKDDNTCAMKK